MVINDKADGARYPVRWGLSLLSLPTASEEHGRPPKPHVTETFFGLSPVGSGFLSLLLLLFELKLLPLDLSDFEIQSIRLFLVPG